MPSMPVGAPVLELRIGVISVIDEAAPPCFLRWVMSRLPSPRGPVGPAVARGLPFTDDRRLDTLLDF